MLAIEATRKSARHKTNPLTAEQKADKVRIETERRNAESSQDVVDRLLDKRHRDATRSATVADSVVANHLVSNKVLNVQPTSDHAILFARTARATREVQCDAQQREAPRARAIKRQQ